MLSEKTPKGWLDIAAIKDRDCNQQDGARHHFRDSEMQEPAGWKQAARQALAQLVDQTELRREQFLRIRHLEDQVGAQGRDLRLLEERIASLELTDNSATERIGTNLATEPSIKQVVKLTMEMFQNVPEFEVEHDPEDPNADFVVITVNGRGTAKELIAMQKEWHRRVANIESDNSGHLRLSIIPLSE